MPVTENLFSYTCAKNCHKIIMFDKVTAKIKRCSFLIHIVFGLTKKWRIFFYISSL